MDASQLLVKRSWSSASDESRILKLWQSLQKPTLSLLRRAATTTSSAATTNTCIASEQSNTCEKPAQMTAALPIALGVTVPIVAIIVFFFLHRRYRKRLRAEDRQDAEKYRSMDFGMDLDAAWKKGGKKKGPEMAYSNSTRQMKGLSIDPTHNPFFLSSDKRAKESADSLFEEEDRYKLVKVMDSRSNSRAGTPVSQFGRQGRVPTDSTITTNTQFGSEVRLVSHAEAPAMSPPLRSASIPLRGDSMSPDSGKKSQAVMSEYREYEMPHAPAKPEPAVVKNGGLMVPSSKVDRDSYFEKNAAAIRKSNNYLHEFFAGKPSDKQIKEEADASLTSSASTVVDTRNNSLHTSDSTVNDVSPSVMPPMPHAEQENDYNTTSDHHNARQFGSPPAPAESKRAANFEHYEPLPYPPRQHSFGMSTSHTPSFVSEGSNLTDILRTPRDSEYDLPPVPALPQIPARGDSFAAAAPIAEEHEPSYNDTLDVYSLGEREAIDGNRLSVLLRPLPPDDPMENPEERANRIRSFYKEYFDDSKRYTSAVPMPAPQSQAQSSHPRPPPSHSDYYEDYSSEYLNEGTVYDSHQQGFVVASAPYAEPVTRRAMTPPPRAPPRFQAHGSPAPRSRAASGAGARGPPMSPRNASAMSNRYPPRGQSAMSHRNRHQGFQKPVAPPKSLNSLPTPHMLKNDAAIFGAADFAPPLSFRDRQNGRRPESPLGVQRPFSPSVRPFVPLNSSFDDLSYVPSPHMLRNSGAFNNLDFAAPPRFRNADTGSDASSIRSGRSGRSGISAGQHHAMRAGAYRISRAPKELIGTKTDIMGGLKPQWDLSRPA